MKRTALILLGLLPVLAFSCTDYSPEDPDPKKCHAGEEWDGEKCVPIGCSMNIHCDDGDFCSGVETCGPDGKCNPGVPVECPAAYPCITSACNKTEGRCDYDLNHESCPPGQVCDPGAGCVTGTACTDAEQCPERFCFLERMCENDVCTWGLPRDCSDELRCTEDKCNEARDECDHIPHDTLCQSADPCLLGRCDPNSPGSDLITGCTFVPLAGPPEICDGIDNDCNGLVDDKRVDETEGSICACMTPCESQADCNNVGGGAAQCIQIDEVGSFCVATCDMNGNCDSPGQGLPMACVTLEWSGLVTQSCMCQPDQCPQNCANDQECFVYGLTRCVGGRCTSLCSEDEHCPDPYFCDSDLGYCSCPLDPGASCLACVLSIQCELMGLGNLCYDMDRGVPYNECKMHCSPDSPCPSNIDLPDLYCHRSTLCSCSPPEGLCEDCSRGQHVCDPYRMECSQVAFAQMPPVHMCTAPCDTDLDCPEGWVCQFVEGSAFRCVDPVCLECYELWCDLQDPFACETLSLECVPQGGAGEGVCSRYCSDNWECPVGTICNAGVCRCPG